jgi:hypothetical protein
LGDIEFRFFYPDCPYVFKDYLGPSLEMSCSGTLNSLPGFWTEGVKVEVVWKGKPLFVVGLLMFEERSVLIFLLLRKEGK